MRLPITTHPSKQSEVAIRSLMLPTGVQCERSLALPTKKEKQGKKHREYPST